jgi:DNA-damage-inducible protein J
MGIQDIMAKPKSAGDAAKTGMIRARIDPDLKVRAEAILGQLGLNASDAIRLFYTQITLSEGLPFDVRIPNAATRKTIRDAWAGKNVKHYASTDEMFEELGI